MKRVVSLQEQVVSQWQKWLLKPSGRNCVKKENTDAGMLYGCPLGVYENDRLASC